MPLKGNPTSSGGEPVSGGLPISIPMSGSNYYVGIASGTSNTLVSRGTFGKTAFLLTAFDAGLHISRLGVNVATALAGSYCQLGLYTVGSDGLPDTLVCQGAVDSTTTGFKEVIIDETLEGGWYYFAIDSTSGTAFSAVDNVTNITTHIGSWNPTQLANVYKPNSVLASGVFPSSVDISASSGHSREDQIAMWVRDV